MGLTLGGDGPTFGESYFNPLSGGYDAPVRYRQFIDTGRRQTNWLPPGLTMRQVRTGETKGFKRKQAADSVPGVVWVKL